LAIPRIEAAQHEPERRFGTERSELQRAAYDLNETCLVQSGIAEGVPEQDQPAQNWQAFLAGVERICAF
jgi:hypothetical protein